MSYEFEGGYKIRNQGATHFLTFTIEGWIDLFSRKQYRDIVLNSLEFCRQKKALKIHAYVIMTNHIHTIWTAPNKNMSDIIRDFKTFTSKSFLSFIETNNESRKEWLLYMFTYFGNRSNANKKYKVWTNDNHPEEIYSKDFFMQKLNYIHQNPVRAGVVENDSDFMYSSALNYAGKKGLIEIDYLGPADYLIGTSISRK